MTEVKSVRPIHVIAREIHANWASTKSGVYFGAVPYLRAMYSLDGINEMYGDDDARSIVRYFLANAKTFRGERARALKAELKEILKGAK